MHSTPYSRRVEKEAVLIVDRPAKLWKVIVVLPNEDAEVRKNTRVIAVLMPNDQTVDHDWGKYRTSVAEIEKLTGYNFFRNVPDDVAKALREHIDDVAVKVLSQRRSR